MMNSIQYDVFDTLFDQVCRGEGYGKGHVVSVSMSVSDGSATITAELLDDPSDPLPRRLPPGVILS